MKAHQHTAVGVFVLIGLLCVAWLTVRLGRMEIVGGSGFEITARFTSVSGLRVGADVEMSGVPVGRVSAICLNADPADRRAVVILRLDEDLRLSDDTIASVRTSGLIGDRYVSLSPGGSDAVIPAGGEITETEAATDLESIISKYAHGGV